MERVCVCVCRGGGGGYDAMGLMSMSIWRTTLTNSSP